MVLSNEEEKEKYGEIIDHNSSFYIFDKDGALTISWLVGVGSYPVYEPLDRADYEQFKAGKHNSYDLIHKAAHGVWPPTQEEQDRVNKQRVAERPIILVNDPSSQELFSKEELKELIPVAEKQWIDWKGSLPEGYVSPV